MQSQRGRRLLLAPPPEPDEATVARLDTGASEVHLDDDFVERVATRLAKSARPHRQRAWGSGLKSEWPVVLMTLLLVATGSLLVGRRGHTPAAAPGDVVLIEDPSQAQTPVGPAPGSTQSPPGTLATRTTAPPTRGSPLLGNDVNAHAIAVWLSDREASAALQRSIERLRREVAGVGCTRTLGPNGTRGFRVSYPDGRLERYVYDPQTRSVVRR